jgi:hypothetical protein
LVGVGLAAIVEDSKVVSYKIFGIPEGLDDVAEAEVTEFTGDEVGNTADDVYTEELAEADDVVTVILLLQLVERLEVFEGTAVVMV